MLENVRIEYHAEVTINTGNFSNVKPGYALSADVAPGTNPDDARAELKRLVDGWLEEDIDEHRADNK